MRSLTRFALPIAALAVVVAACSNTSEPTETTVESTTTVADTTAGTDDLVFGSGSMPDTVPTDFPFPEQAVIGSTLIDRTRGLTEVITTYPANVEEVAAFYEANLPTFGFVIGSSGGSDGAWTLVFTRDGLEGVIELDTAGSSLSQGSIRITQATG
jgi:hypothetical protein